MEGSALFRKAGEFGVSNTEHPYHKIYLKWTLYLFMFVLCAGFFLHIFIKDQKISEEENRVLMRMPEFSISSFLAGDFEENFEDYCSDQFPARNYFIKLQAQTELLLGKREVSDVILGEDSYLMEKFVPDDEKNNSEKFDKMEKLHRHYPSIRQYFLLAPTAVNLLSDKLPEGIPVQDQNVYMDEAAARFNDMGGRFIDVREELSLANEGDIYYHTDHHWTSYGAYVAAQKALSVMGFNPHMAEYEPMPVYDAFHGSLSYKSGFLQGWTDVIDVYFPTKQEMSIEVNYVEERQKTKSLYNHKKLPSRESYELFLDGNHSLVKISSDEAVAERKLLLIKDSYANSFIPFLTAYFKEIIVVDPRYYYDDLRELIEVEEISDLLYLYNANTFFADKSLGMILE